MKVFIILCLVCSVVYAFRQERSHYDYTCLTKLITDLGLNVVEFDTLLKSKGYSLEQFKNDLKPGMTIQDIEAILLQLGLELNDLRKFLGKYGVILEDVMVAVRACRQKRSFDTNCLEDLLERHGLTKQELQGILNKYGYSIAELVADASRPGVTLQDVLDKLQALGVNYNALQALLANYGTNLEEVVGAFRACKN